MAQHLHAALHASGMNASLELYGPDDKWLMDLDAKPEQGADARGPQLHSGQLTPGDERP